MAAYTIAANAVFPSGSTVGAYLLSQVDLSGTPSGSPVTTATAGAGGAVTFASGLTEATTYHAMTQVSTVWRRITFTTAPLGSIPVGAPVAGPTGAKGDKGDQGDQGPAGSAGPELTAEIANRQAADTAHVLALNPHGDRTYTDTQIAATLTSLGQATPEYAAALAALSVPMMRVQALTADFLMPSPKTTAVAIPGAVLTLDGGADEMWVWDLSLRFDTTGAQDLRLDLTRPSGALEGNWGPLNGPSNTIAGWAVQAAGAADPLTPATLAGALSFHLRSGRNTIALRVSIDGNASAGPVQVTMRQNTTNAADMTLIRGPIGSAVRNHA